MEPCGPSTCKNGTYLRNFAEPPGTNLNLKKWNLYVEPFGTSTFSSGTSMRNLAEPGSRFRSAAPNQPEALLEEPQACHGVGEAVREILLKRGESSSPLSPDTAACESQYHQNKEKKKLQEKLCIHEVTQVSAATPTMQGDPAVTSTLGSRQGRLCHSQPGRMFQDKEEPSCLKNRYVKGLVGGGSKPTYVTQTLQAECFFQRKVNRT